MFLNGEWMWEFVPEDVWKTLATADFAIKAMEFFIGIGLRPPSEHTLSVLAGAFFLAVKTETCQWHTMKHTVKPFE